MRKPTKVTIGDFAQSPCVEYMRIIARDFGKNPFDPLRVIRESRGHPYDYIWLAENCEKARTEELMKHFIKSKPDACDLSNALEVPFFQTETIVEMFLKVCGENMLSELKRMNRGDVFIQKISVQK